MKRQTTSAALSDDPAAIKKRFADVFAKTCKHNPAPAKWQ